MGLLAFMMAGQLLYTRFNELVNSLEGKPRP